MTRFPLLGVPLAIVAVSAAGRGAGGPAPHVGPAAIFGHGDLRVSDNKRFLVHRDGTPFFYLADTAWELFHRPSRDDVEHYLEKRRQQGFTVVHGVLLSEFDGLTVPNALGHLPLVDGDPTRPDVRPGAQDDYWDDVDFVVDTAAKKGIYVGLLPTWADKVGVDVYHRDKIVFDVANARGYGRFLGRRYRGKPNVLWVLGGDRPVAFGGTDTRPVWRALAAGIREGESGRHLMTFHPWRPDSSSRWWQADSWLDFNMLQSGHGAKDWPNYARIAADYHSWPPKPCLDGEPRYEDHPVNREVQLGYFDEYDVRQAAYWAVFAGAFGHTYGSNDVWQFYVPGKALFASPRTPWKEALDQGGAWSMLSLRRLMLSRPFLGRIPDPSLIVSGQGVGAEHIEATRDQGGAYAFIYVPTGKTVTVDLHRVGGTRVKAWWFDPRGGTSTLIGEFEATKRSDFFRDFDPPRDPSRGNDWVLVLDDATKGYPPPGEAR